MAKKSASNSSRDSDGKFGDKFDVSEIIDGVKGETKRAILALVIFVVVIFIILSVFQKGGSAGAFTYSILSKLVGSSFGYWTIILTLLLVAVAFLKNIERKFSVLKIISSFLLFISLLGISELLFPNSGGILGHYFYYPLYSLFSVYVSFIIFLALIIISLLIIFETHFTLENLAFWKAFGKFRKASSENKDLKIKIGNDKILDETIISLNDKKDRVEEKDEDGTEDQKDNKDQKPANEKDKKSKFASAFSIFEDEDIPQIILKSKPVLSRTVFNPPPLSLLERDRGRPETGDIKSNANVIKRTLQNFGINVEMDEVSIGPSVTRYALKPAEGVKLSKIVSLNSDLALALAAHPIRIEAPIPGKSLVGIEVPNSMKSLVGLATLLSADDFQKSEKPLMVSLGKSISGKCYFANLAKAPHMLIAGATGSGKSVTIHTIITSLLFRNSPEMLKFIFIDPKRVELTLYNKIPHLLTPVITDAKKAILSLRWAGREMNRRYDILESHTCRDIDSYHKNILAPALEKARKENALSEELPETMPYIAIVMDELADIMQTYPRELESAVVKLAQMSRAVGIHLILSTQRPSVNIITGLIKANIPTRVALQVSSQIDSRTILDQGGAEKLLGAGDMLYLGAEMPNPVRLQSAFISENEVKKVVKYLVDAYKDELYEKINLDGKDAESEPGSGAIFSASIDEDDDLYGEARRIILESGKASTSYLQRKLRIGYSRAARLMDLLEQKGAIGPSDGSRAREVIDPEYKGPANSDGMIPDEPDNESSSI
ncbi:MAG: DNA translocase FtsK [bacterium]|nr:DNA translocase FtsK [bacterium]